MKTSKYLLFGILFIGKSSLNIKFFLEKRFLFLSATFHLIDKLGANLKKKFLNSTTSC